MDPILFNVGSVAVPSYPFMLSLSFLLGGLLFVFLGHRQGASIHKLIWLAVIVQLSAEFGSRVLFVLNRGDDPANVFLLSPGGFYVNGGIAVAVLAAIIYIRLAGLQFWKVADWAASPLALGILLTKIGCFLGGCCFGAPTNLPWGVEFPVGSPAASALGIPHSVHPAQIYEALAGLAILVAVLYSSKRRTFDGSVFLTLAIMYMGVRVLNDFLRGDRLPAGLWDTSQTQLISLVFWAIAVTAFWVRSRTREEILVSRGSRNWSVDQPALGVRHRSVFGFLDVSQKRTEHREGIQ